MYSREHILNFLFSLLLIGCRGLSGRQESIELITDASMQDSIFKQLIEVTSNSLPEMLLDDSLAFLILPVQASCPSCRKKAIDSICEHYDGLLQGHFIIISANGGRKTINAYFQEQKRELPVIEKRIFLDTTNKAYRFDLYESKPTLYYTYGRKVYKRVSAVPATVKQDLSEFFSGSRVNIKGKRS